MEAEALFWSCRLGGAALAGALLFICWFVQYLFMSCYLLRHHVVTEISVSQWMNALSEGGKRDAYHSGSASILQSQQIESERIWKALEDSARGI
jgi:hypothetical protein